MEYKKVGYKNKKHPAARLQRETMLFVVLYLRENQNMTFGQIGKEFSKSKQWARQKYLQSVAHFNQTDQELHDSLTQEQVRGIVVLPDLKKRGKK